MNWNGLQQHVTLLVSYNEINQLKRVPNDLSIVNRGKHKSVDERRKSCNRSTGKYPVGARRGKTCNRCHKNAGNHKLSAGKHASGANGVQEEMQQHQTSERMQSQEVVPVFVNSFFFYFDSRGSIKAWGFSRNSCHKETAMWSTERTYLR